MPDELASLMVSRVNTLSLPPSSSNFCLLATAAVLPESQREFTIIGGPFTQPLLALHTATCLLGRPSSDVLNVQTLGCLHLPIWPLPTCAILFNLAPGPGVGHTAAHLRPLAWLYLVLWLFPTSTILFSFGPAVWDRPPAGL